MKKELTMTTTLLPETVLRNFKHFAKTKDAASLPQEWLVQFVEHGLMYWHDETHADYTGLGEEMLDDDRRDRGVWEPLAMSAK